VLEEDKKPHVVIFGKLKNNPYIIYDKKQNKMTIFDFLKEITGNKKAWSSFSEEDQKQFNPYMVHRYISMYEPYIDVANIAQLLPHNDKEKIYQFYCSMIPKNNVWLKYMKGSKKKPNETILKYVSKYYTISLGEAEEYLHLLKKEGIHSILSKSGVDEKKIKKLLKDLVL
jgi:hypothetical protein